MFNLGEYLEKTTKIHAKPNENWVIDCSCDRRDHTAEGHLWVSVRKQLGYCFRCQARYSLVDLVQLVEGCSFREAVAFLRDLETPKSRLSDILAKLAPEDDTEEDASPKKIELPDEYDRIRKKVPRYLERRGVSLDDCRRYELGVCHGGFYRNRIIVPVYDVKGELALFVARWAGTPKGDTKKVIYPKGARTSKVIFNHQQALLHKTVVVVEGVFDAIRVGHHAVALLGKHASREQIGHLVSLGQTRRIVIMLDNDGTATDDAEALAEELSEVCPDVRIAHLPHNRKDPGECTPAELRRATKRARPLGTDRLKDTLKGLKTAF